MNFSDFAALCYELEKTPSWLAKVGAAADYLRRLAPDEIRPGVAFLSGRAFAISDPRTLDVGPRVFAHLAEIPQHEKTILPQLTIEDAQEGLRETDAGRHALAGCQLAPGRGVGQAVRQAEFLA
jgi:hypothetical protein